MKIVALEAENVKYLKVVRIEPDGSLVVVGGNNAQGKTCVLDSIEYALNGAGGIPSQPIRAGQKKARIVLDMGDIVVTRTFTSKGTNLTVKNKDGSTFASPQDMLNKLKGKLTFDPLEFSRMDAKKQSEVLKQLVGLNFDKVNAQYKKLFDERTIINRKGKETKAILDSMTRHENVPGNEVSIQQLGTDYNKAIEHNQQIKQDANTLSQEMAELKQLEKRVAELKKSIKQKQKALNGIEKIDIEVIRKKIAEVEDTNLKVRENKAYDSTNKSIIELRKQSKFLSDQMVKIENDKAKILAKAKFPIDGLAIDDDGVTFEGVPLTQCSMAQKIRISVAIGLAMNPKLRILLIREGSLLDENNLAMVAKMADDADAQVWLERVGKGDECQVIIEDGEIVA
jgi:recombinational DNA repair ATPase RecF